MPGKVPELDPRVEAIRVEYGLHGSDFWELPQKKGTYCAKHAALEIVAAKAGIKFDMPQVIEARSADGIAAVCVQGEMNGRFVWSIGECSPKNNRNSYPYAMAEKRAIDRVILKLIGIHGLVYSEDEMPPDDDRRGSDLDTRPQPSTAGKYQGEPPVLPKAKARELYTEMSAELAACMTLDELGILWRSNAFRGSFLSLPEDWKQLIEAEKDELKVTLSEPSKTLGEEMERMGAADGR